jgi:hypothetical protein
MIKKMITTLKSRNSMKPIEYLFTDGLFNSKFYLYEDADGFKWIAKYPFNSLFSKRTFHYTQNGQEWICNDGTLKHYPNHNTWVVSWGGKSQEISNTVNTSNFIEGAIINVINKYSPSEKKVRSFPI